MGGHHLRRGRLSVDDAGHAADFSECMNILSRLVLVDPGRARRLAYFVLNAASRPLMAAGLFRDSKAFADVIDGDVVASTPAGDLVWLRLPDLHGDLWACYAIGRLEWLTRMWLVRIVSQEPVQVAPADNEGRVGWAWVQDRVAMICGVRPDKVVIDRAVGRCGGQGSTVLSRELAIAAIRDLIALHDRDERMLDPGYTDESSLEDDGALPSMEMIWGRAAMVPKTRQRHDSIEELAKKIRGV